MFSHQGTAGSLDDGIVISEEEFDSMSKKNVENWVSAHIVPVSPSTTKLFGPLSAFKSQVSPISFDTHEHPTLLHHKSITFTPLGKNDGNGAPWSRVTLDDGVQITGMKEVCSLHCDSFKSFELLCASQASNGVLYMIDGVISYD